MEYWKYKAIDKLQDYPALQNALKSIPDEISALEISSKSIKSASAEGTPVQGGGSTREDRLLSNIVEREELRRNYRQAQYACRIVERGLAVLNDDDKQLLGRMYIHRQRGAVERLMEDMGLAEPKSVYRKANKALLKFTLACYGLSES